MCIGASAEALSHPGKTTGETGSGGRDDDRVGGLGL